MTMEIHEKTWSTEDKRRLLFLLHHHGSLNLQLLQEKLPHKSCHEIRDICDKHLQLAEQENEEAKLVRKHRPALKNWIKIMRNVNDSQEEPIKNIISRALKYITLFERRQYSPVINLTSCYQMLSDMCQGLDLRGLERSNSYFLRECLKQLSDEVKAPGVGSLKKLLKAMDRIDKSKHPETICKILNPLHFPQEVLDLTILEKNYNMFE